MLNDPAEAAEFIRTKWNLGLNGGVLIANPVPEEDAFAANEIENVIVRALADAEQRHIRGKDVTPFLLDRVKELTGGKSLDTNVALVKHNARVGTAIAVELAKRKGK